MKTTTILIVCLVFQLGADRPATTRPSEDVVSASVAIAKVQLSYTGPLRVPIGQPINIHLRLENGTATETFLYGNENDFAGTTVTITDADGKQISTFTTKGTKTSRTEGHLAILASNELIEEQFDLAKYCKLQEGTYYLRFWRQFDGVVKFPERHLIISGIPIEIIKQEQEKR